MKRDLACIAVLAFVTALVMAFSTTPETRKNISKIDRSFARAIIACSPDRNLLDSLSSIDIPPISGAGSWNWPINTTSDSAQFYFNQGIRTYYSFHIIESMASFKKAARFDSTNAIIQWAEALAYGPNINDVEYSTAAAAIEATVDARRLDARNEKERLLIAAISVRYSADASINQGELNRRYAEKMKVAYLELPKDPDIAALYADALMLLHPWDLWLADGTPRPWTPELRMVLEKLLAQTPDHPGANHYYIHVMEPSPFFDKATLSADRLGKLTPGLSHTVHMPSHIYLRTGQYQQGIVVNEKALEGYAAITKSYAPAVGGDFLYNIHTRHMLVNNAMLAANARVSIESARALIESIPPEYLETPGAMGNVVQYIYMAPVFVDIRFARWNELLAMTPPAASTVYASLLFHWGRGMALANTSRLAEAASELSIVQKLAEDSSLLLPFTPFSPAIDGARIATDLLQGTIALKRKDFTTAIRCFTQATITEERMVYNEPRDWMLNPRHYLGQAYLAAGRLNEASGTFRKDLLNNNNNLWALTGLYQAELGRKDSAAKKLKAKVHLVAAMADIPVTAAVL